MFMQSKYYTISPKSGEYEDSTLTSVLRIFAIVFFVGGLIGGYTLGKQFSDIQNLFATSYRDRVDFSWGLAIAVWLSAALSGSLMLALREALLTLRLHQTQSYTLVIPVSETNSESAQGSGMLHRAGCKVIPTNEIISAPTQGYTENYVQCPSCGQKQRADRTVCLNCGAWLAQT